MPFNAYARLSCAADVAAVSAGIRLTLNIDQPVVRITCETIGQASCAQCGRYSVKGKRAMPITVMTPPTSMVLRMPNRLANAPLGRPIPM